MEEDGRWGLIDMEGNPLIGDEFKKKPSVAINGMFCVKNSDGLFEFYTAEKDFKQIGDEYLEVGYFSEGLAPVVKKDSRITYINRKGEVIFELTKYKDDPIVSANSFEYGIALIKTASGKEGCINIKGEFVVPPIYSSIYYAGDNTLLVKNEKDKFGYINYKGEVLIELKYSDGRAFNKNGYTIVEKEGKKILINLKGHEILEIQDGMNILSFEDENLMPCSIGGESFCYINKSGEKVIKLPSNISEADNFSNGYAIYMNEDLDYGIINKKGEIIIRAKYDELKMYDDVILYKDKQEWGFISYSGEVIKRACYKEVAPFWEGYNTTFAKDGEEWILINRKGEEVKKKDMPNIYNLFDFYGNGYSHSVKSDYFDVDTEVRNIMSILNEDGTIDKMTFEMTPKEFENIYTNSETRNENRVSCILPSSKYIGFHVVSIQYTDKIKIPNYERRWIESRWGGYWDNVVTGYLYNNNIGIMGLDYWFELQDKLINKKQELYKSLQKYLKDIGYKLINESPEGKEKFYMYEKSQHRLTLAIFNDTNCLQIITVKN